MVSHDGALSPRRLPAQPTPLLGRANDLATVVDLVLSEDVRLLTLTGPAGIGKTRLALAVAQEVGGAFDGGVRFVDLSAASEDDGARRAINRALGVPDVEPHLWLDAFERTAGEDKLLLILDNCEHVLSSANLVSALVQARPKITVLATSREPLHLRWEHTYLVPPLPVPDLVRLPPLEELSGIPGVALFIRRARAVKREFVLTEDNARNVAEICVRLDGLPLAIELAASHANVLSPAAMLGQYLSHLHWEAQDMPPRHRTLSAAMGGSYELLTPEEQTVFRHLGVFVNGFSDAAVDAVVAGPTPAMDILISLVDKNMVQVTEQRDGYPRFSLLQTIREYANQLLMENDELEAARSAHSSFYLRMGEMLEAGTAGSEQLRAGLEVEQDNLRAAFAWAAPPDAGEVEIRLAAALARLGWLHGSVGEGRRWLERVLEGDGTVSATSAADSSGSGPMTPDTEGRFTALHAELLKIGSREVDGHAVARSLLDLGAIVMDAGNVRDAEAILLDSLALYRRDSDPLGCARTLGHLGEVARVQGDNRRARELYEEGLALYELEGYARGAIYNLGIIALLGDDMVQARGLLRRALDLSETVGERALSLWVCLVAAEVLSHIEDPQKLARVVVALEYHQDSSDEIRSLHKGGRLQRVRTAVMDRVRGDGMTVTADEGRGMTADEVVEVIRALLGPEESATVTIKSRNDRGLLTDRETEILRLIAEGLSNKQIAGMLFISDNTVKAHVTSVFNKLGAETRAQAVALAAHADLL